MKRTLSLILISVLLLFSLAACASDAPGIKDMPYPHAPEELLQLRSTDMDYASTNSIADLWNRVDWVVVGYYEDTAPRSCNINRSLDDPANEADNFYLESLIYQFHVVSVLKGDMDAGINIPLGILHGQRIGDYTYPLDTFVQPDAQSYKVMFLLYDDICDKYYAWDRSWWLSTAPIQSLSNTVDWTQLEFLTQSALPYERGDKYANAIHYDLALPSDGVMAASNTPRDSYTGAELLTYAETLDDVS